MVKIDFTPKKNCDYCGKEFEPNVFHYCTKMRKATEAWARKVCKDIEDAHKKAAHSKLKFNSKSPSGVEE